MNTDLAEKITEDYAISECQSAPISGTLYKESLVTIKEAGVFWHNHIWDNIRISSLSELIQFLTIMNIKRAMYWKIKKEKYIP